MMNLRTMAVLAASLAVLCSNAQQFDYTVTRDSSGWQELSGHTILNTGGIAWAESYRIPIGFNFPCSDSLYDSLTVTANGYIVFDVENRCAFTAYNRFTGLADNIGNYPAVGYLLSGTPGNQVLKIQFKEVTQHEYPALKLSYQLWLNENGIMEVRVGPHSYPVGTDSTNIQRIGFLNMNMNSTVRGYFIQGNPSAPGAQQVTVNSPDIPELFGLPASGTRYYFTPTN